MKTSKIGAYKIVKDTDRVGLIETGIPRITYPWSFTTSYFNIEQDFICDADSVPTFIHSLPHSKYPTSKSVSQSGATIVSTGIARFTRKYVQFPSNPLTQPSTASVTFPPIAVGVNYQGRGIDTVTETYQQPLTATTTFEDGTTRTSNVLNPDGSIATVTAERQVPAVTQFFRKHGVTKVVPVISVTSFIYMGSYMQTTYIRSSAVGAGTVMNGKVVAKSEYTENGYLITFEDGTQTMLSHKSSVQIQSPVQNIGSIDVDEPFSIIDNYFGYEGAQVEFIDDNTIPSRSEFLSSTNQDKLLFASQINHIEGLLYTKKNIFGKIQ